MVAGMSEALSSLAEAFKNVGVSRAYGPAVRVDGEELIPVALVSFGFGGGGTSEGGTGSPGAGTSSDAVAAGGGGGGFVLPLGVYGRGRSGRVAFRPNTVAVLAGLTPLVCAVGFAARVVLRAVR
jgi:uncharacterized spore protein YtfJ